MSVQIEKRFKLVVLTPVRNEAWILPAFLKATSLWADHIIIADQRSTDGSREIALSFPKVVLIDNNSETMHQANARKILFEEAKKIEGDKILFAMDADEFLSGNFPCTQDWRTIMESGPNSVFCFDWLNVSKDGKCSLIECNYYWAAHPGDGFWSGEFPDNFIHEWRLPYPTNIKKDKEFILKEIRFLHFGTYNAERTSNKLKFYQVSSLHGAMQGRNTKYNFVNLYRQYHSEAPSFGNWTNLPGDAFDYYEQNGINILSEINITDAGEHYVTEILRYFKEDGVSKYAMLDIWDDDFVLKSGLKDPRTVLDRMLLSYLKISNKYRNNVVIKVLDKLIGKVF